MKMMAKKVRILLAERGINQTQLAKLLGMTQANISMKLAKDNMTEEDMRRIADVLDCDFEGTFVLRESGKRI